MKSLCGDSRRYQNGLRARTYKKNDGYSKDHPEPQEAVNCRSVDLHNGEKGQTTVVMALFMATFLFGFVALGIDIQSLFHAKRMAQAAADAAAMAAAEESGNGTTSEQAAANAMAKLNGFDTTLGKNPATVTLSVPSGGNYSGSSSYIQAIVSKPIPTFFMDVINTRFATMTVSARAVSAAGQSSPTCVCLLGTTGTDLNLSNNANLTPSGCGTTVDSSSSNAIAIVGSATLSGLSIGSVSTNWDNSGNVNNGGSIAAGTQVVEGISTQCSPPLPTVPTYNAAQCTADPLGSYGNGGRTYSVGARSGKCKTQTGSVICYNSLLVGTNNDKVTLNPGIYVIKGGQLHFESGNGNASNQGGNGVFFYLVGGASLVIDNGANANLTAPTSGSYAGALLFQDPADTQTISIQGGSNTSFNGAVYAPTAGVTLGNGSGRSIDGSVE